MAEYIIGGSLEMNENYYEALMRKMEEMEKRFNAMSPLPLQEQNTSENRHTLSFTEKEIMKMPKSARKIFRIQGHVVHYRKRNTGRYKCSYELYYAKKPYNNPPISASGTTLEEAKARFIEKLKNYTPRRNAAFVAPPKEFHEFAMYWFEHFHKRKVIEPTYKHDFATYSRDIEKQFRGIKLPNITPVYVQEFLDGYQGKGRTAETLHSLLNQIFNCAVKHGVIVRNPLDMCFWRKHEREHGRALSKDEEKTLLSTYANTDFQIDFAIALYTGLRPNEYASAEIHGDFIVAKNSKRKGGKTEIKRVPITPMLKPYINGISQLHLHCPDAVTKRLKAVLPNHILYDMRTTFQTRCTECGIAEVAIGLFMGNGIGSELKKAYTDVSDEWLLSEAKKLNY